MFLSAMATVLALVSRDKSPMETFLHLEITSSTHYTAATHIFIATKSKLPYSHSVFNISQFFFSR